MVALSSLITKCGPIRALQRICLFKLDLQLLKQLCQTLVWVLGTLLRSNPEMNSAIVNSLMK